MASGAGAGRQPPANGEVAEITDLLEFGGWPEGSRMIVRLQGPHPGAQLSFTDHDGYRFQAILTDQCGSEVAVIERRHRARARVEDQIRDDKEHCLAKLPFRSFRRTRSGSGWSRSLTTCSPGARRCCSKASSPLASRNGFAIGLLHVAARLAFSGRRARLRLQAGWPWAEALAAAFARLAALPVS